MEEAVNKACNMELTKCEMRNIKTENIEDVNYNSGSRVYKHSQSNRKSSNQDNSNGKLQCFICKGPHYARHCKNRDIRENSSSGSFVNLSNTKKLGSGQKKFHRRCGKQHRVNAVDFNSEVESLQHLDINNVKDNNTYSRPHTSICD